VKRVVASERLKRLYVAQLDMANVSVIDALTGETTNVVTGRGPEGIAISPHEREVWVSNRDDDTVSVIATAQDVIIGEFDSAVPGQAT